MLYQINTNKMGEAVEKLEDINPFNQSNAEKIINNTLTEEIIIALCGQIGTDLKQIKNTIIEILTTNYNYTCQEIKLSEFISQKSSFKIDKATSEYERIKLGIEGGNELRQQNSNSILAKFAIAQIAEGRTKESEKKDSENQTFRSRRKCYIINSIKHPKELEVLRNVYGNMLYSIGVFSSINNRVNRLKRKRIDISDIYTLIDRDSGEDLAYGQAVEDTFVESDYFLRVSNDSQESLSKKITRFINLIFDNCIITPTNHESAMYQAVSAAVNSACLSRQVGAAITNKHGRVISTGWNDVPKYGGNLYTNDTEDDFRCYCFEDKECANTRKKDQIADEIVNALEKEALISSYQRINVKEVLLKNGIKSLIEFARSIHAEMHAIILGAQQTGTQMIDGKLYCTTYPCHNCARHIIVAGIKEVYYIEPYKKSLGTELHSDAINNEDQDGESTNKLKILMYEGVAPKRYIDFYKMRDNRKNKMQPINTLKPKNMVTLRAIHQLESIVFNEVCDI